MTTTRIADQFTVSSCKNRGDIGVAVCVCRPLTGRRVNTDAANRALEHTFSGDEKHIISTHIGCSYIIVEVAMPEPEANETEESIELHVQAIAGGLISGLADYLAITDEDLTEPTITASSRDRELIGSLSD